MQCDTSAKPEYLAKNWDQHDSFCFASLFPIVRLFCGIFVVHGRKGQFVVEAKHFSTNVGVGYLLISHEK